MGTGEHQVDPAAAARVINREGVTIFQVTPSRLQMFLSLQEAAARIADRLLPKIVKRFADKKGGKDG